MSRPGWCKAPDRVWEEGRSPPFHTLGSRGACWADLCIGFRSEATPLRCCATRLRAQPNGGLGRNLFARPGACTPVCEFERGTATPPCSGRAHAFSANERSQTGLPEHPEQGRALGCAQHGRFSGRLWGPALAHKLFALARTLGSALGPGELQSPRSLTTPRSGERGAPTH